MVDLLNKRQPALTIQQIKLHRGTRVTVKLGVTSSLGGANLIVAIMICNRLG